MSSAETRLQWLRRVMSDRDRKAVADVAIAVVATILVQSEIWLSDDMDPRLPLSLLGIAVTVPLAWRRTVPIAAALVVSAGNAGMGLLAEGTFGPQVPLLPLAVALYSAAAYSSGRRAVVGGAVTLALVVAGNAGYPDGDAGDFFPWALWAAAWLAGSLVSRRTADAGDARRRAILAEETKDAARAEAAAQERDRIARELHDVVAHAVSVMVVQAGAERLRLGEAGTADERTGEVLAAVEDTGRQALRELRTMLAVLRDGSPEPDRADLAPVPDLSHLPALVERLRATGLPVVLEQEGPTLTFPPGLELSAYRIVQEALTNVVRHVGCVDTSVRVSRARDGVRVSVTNGPGRRSPDEPGPASATGAGRGLLGMNERVATLGGRLDADPTDDGGFAVHAFLPFARVGSPDGHEPLPHVGRSSR